MVSFDHNFVTYFGSVADWLLLSPIAFICIFKLLPLLTSVISSSRACFSCKLSVPSIGSKCLTSLTPRSCKLSTSGDKMRSVFSGSGFVEKIFGDSILIFCLSSITFMSSMSKRTFLISSLNHSGTAMLAVSSNWRSKVVATTDIRAFAALSYKSPSMTILVRLVTGSFRKLVNSRQMPAMQAVNNFSIDCINVMISGMPDNCSVIPLRNYSSFSPYKEKLIYIFSEVLGSANDHKALKTMQKLRKAVNNFSIDCINVMISGMPDNCSVIPLRNYSSFSPYKEKLIYIFSEVLGSANDHKALKTM
ncbi:hypothetical protein M513_06847 [Trichuris suis]|uniref:Uncharacterized protein n=1 Tax=Trichuris suis TaxID=68888 RepID=A0A085M4Y8_9BILA|nr:hypothetical protein M513_06847 [Trichuris suis]